MINQWLTKVTMAVGLSLPLLGLTAASVFAERVKIAVINNSGKTMTGLYAGGADEPWGENLLEASVPDRETTYFDWDQADYEGTSLAGCVFDVRAVYSDGKYTDLFGIDLCKESSINFK